MPDGLTPYEIGRIIGILIGVVFAIGLPILFIVSLVLLLTSKKKGWLFVVIPSGLLSLVLLLQFSVGFVRGFKRGLERAKSSSSESALADRVVTSTDGIAQVKLPGHWKTLDSLNAQAQLKEGNLAREEYFMCINEPKGDFTGTLADYGKIVSGNLQDNMDDDVAVSGPEKITVNGHDAVQYKLVGKIKKVPISYLLTAVETEKNFHQISEWTLQSKEDKAFPLFREVLQTFTLVEEKSN